MDRALAGSRPTASNCPDAREPARRHVWRQLRPGYRTRPGFRLLGTAGSSDGRLFHRGYAELGYAAYLIETAPGEDYAVKSRAYIGAVEQVAESLASDAKLRSALSPSSTSFSLAGVSAYLEPAPTGPIADPEASALGDAGHRCSRRIA